MNRICTIPIATLKEFYENAYSEIRRHTGVEVAVVFHDSFRAMSWQDFMKQPQYSNVIIDTHLYQSFGRKTSNAMRRNN